MAFKGSFSITQWDEDTLSERSEGIKVSHASIKQVYSGEMSGESNVEFLMSYQSQMSAKFTGFETFVGEHCWKHSWKHCLQHEHVHVGGFERKPGVPGT